MQKESICIYINKDGYLERPDSKLSIQDIYKNPIEDVLSFFRKQENNNIHSIYLRGSVAFGSGVEGFSDIDFFIVSKNPMTDFDRTLIKQYMSKLNTQYPFITKFDFGYYTVDQILKMKENVLIKLTSMCIYGEDIRDQIKDPKPGKDVTISLSLIENEMRKTRHEIEMNLYNETNTKPMCVWIMKRIVRSGLEIVSEREGCFTRDLRECFKKFIKYYPEMEEEMSKALSLAVNNTNDLNQILDVFDNIGNWLVKEGKTLKLI